MNKHKRNKPNKNIFCHDDFKENFQNVFQVFNKFYRPLACKPERELDNIPLLYKIDFKSLETWLFFLTVFFQFLALDFFIINNSFLWLLSVFWSVVIIFLWLFRIKKRWENLFFDKIGVIPQNFDIVYLLNIELNSFSTEQLNQAIVYSKTKDINKIKNPCFTVLKVLFTVIIIPIAINLFSDTFNDLDKELVFVTLNMWIPKIALLLAIILYLYFLVNARKMRMQIFQDKIQYILELRKTNKTNI